MRVVTITCAFINVDRTIRFVERDAFVAAHRIWLSSCSLGDRDAYCPQSRSPNVLILLFTALLSSQQVSPVTNRVTGTIVEARTGAPLAAVLVKVQSTGQQGFSDGDGRFEIADVPVGSQTLLVSVVGYGLVRREVTVNATEVVDITIPVAEGASTYVEEVTVGASRFREVEPGMASQSVLGSREILALRGLVADDPFRAVQVLPGVSTGDDFRAEFAVRGLGPGQPASRSTASTARCLFHTVRGVQDTGSLGLINSDILESAALLSGPHPQRLNSHLGSRIDFTTRDGSRERLTVRGLPAHRRRAPSWRGRSAQARRRAGCSPFARAISTGCCGRSIRRRIRRLDLRTDRRSSVSICRRGSHCACR